MRHTDRAGRGRPLVPPGQIGVASGPVARVAWSITSSSVFEAKPSWLVVSVGENVAPLPDSVVADERVHHGTWNAADHHVGDAGRVGRGSVPGTDEPTLLVEVDVVALSYAEIDRIVRADGRAARAADTADGYFEGLAGEFDFRPTAANGASDWK